MAYKLCPFTFLKRFRFLKKDRFPDNGIRGVCNNQYVLENGSIGSALFFFENKFHRDDGWTELSINWEDDLAAIEFTLKQKKPDGEIKFKEGAVKFPRAEIHRIANFESYKGLLSYERQPEKKNPYHGNILLKSGVSKKKMKNIAGCLAVAASKLITKNNI